MGLRESVTELLLQWGLADDIVSPVLDVIFVVAIIFLVIISDIISKRILLNVLGKIVKKTETSWDNILFEQGVFNRLAHVVPALIIYLIFPYAFPDYPSIVAFIENIVFIYIAVITVLVIYAFLNGIRGIYLTFEISKKIPLKGLLQALKIIVILVAGIVILSAMTNKTPLYFLSGLGALTAIFILIFKDAILGLVAGVQLSANDMVREGDWIEMPQFGADGDVIDVSLTTVKVQNWDKTISSIPAYALISQSFKNWRGMSESGGRRIKRAINIDMTSIRFCDEEMLERFSRIVVLRDYIARKKEEISAWNAEHGVDDTHLVNARRMTNIGTFRAYVEAYLRNHPKVRKDMTFLVRQLKPTELGLPLEIYVFSSDQVWAHYEAIQSDIFDHLLAVLPLFDLKVFQNPTGADFRALK